MAITGTGYKENCNESITDKPRETTVQLTNECQTEILNLKETLDSHFKRTKETKECLDCPPVPNVSNVLDEVNNNLRFLRNSIREIRDFITSSILAKIQ